MREQAPYIVLSNTLSIQVPLVIDGAGSITLSGDRKVRIFEVCSPSSNGAHNTELQVVGLTLTNGKSNPNRAGGAITNYGCRVSVVRSHFVDNEAVFEAGAIHSLFDGVVSVEDSRFVGNSATTIGGAIVMQGGQLSVRGSIFRDNQAMGGNGGAIYTHDPVAVDIRQSSFIGNRSTLRGGALSIGGKATVTNSTFWQNSAALAGSAIRHHANAGTMELTNVTVAGKEGKALSGGMSLANSLVSNAANSENCEGSIVAQGPNLEFPGTSCKASLHGVDPQLGELSPSEALPPTVALQSTSPARNAASDTICAAAPVNSVDQRGVARPDAAGKHCDLGAYEFDPSHVPPVLAGTATRRAVSAEPSAPARQAAVPSR